MARLTSDNVKRIVRILDAHRATNPADTLSTDKMVDIVRTTDITLRRLKMAHLRTLVEQALRIIHAQSHQHTASTDPAVDTIEAMSLSDSEAALDQNDDDGQKPNLMNRALAQRYSVAAQEIDSRNDKKRIADNNTTTTTTTTSSSSDKKKRKLNDYSPPNTRYADLGGIDKCIEEVRELIEAPMAHPEIYLHLNITPPRGVLLHGPPGCGKTQLARAVAGELGVPFIQISAPSIVSGMSGESEKKIRDMFEEARSLAPCLFFIDEIDAITPKRETAQREMERRIVAQLLTCMDDLCMENTNNKPVIVIGATNRPDSLDPALRRAGRFDREITMGIPDDQAREQILRVITGKLRLAGDFNFSELAKLTPGYVGADLQALATAAGIIAVKRIFGAISNNSMNEGEDVASNQSNIEMFLKNHPDPLTDEELEPLCINMDDFTMALKKVQPSSKREGFATVPDVSWSDIGALSFVREELRMAIVEPVKNPYLFQSVGISSPAGVLLWGPPGCGKTLLAKAVANESHCNFISVKGPELLNKYVGESERAVRQVFARARASAPCVIFFDELDALCPRRGGGSDSQSTERVVNQLLTEMDGLEGRKDVYIIGATNRPDIIDRAILRPGRLDKLVYVKLPTADERLDILKTLSSKMPLHDDVDLYAIAHHQQCDRFSGADLASLVRESGIVALKSTIYKSESLPADRPSIRITQDHILQALHKIHSSVSKEDLKSYSLIELSLQGQ